MLVKCHYLAPMKKNENKYMVINVLPLNAKTVGSYASSNGITQSYVYHKLSRGKADYKIVVFQNINFVIPLTNN